MGINEWASYLKRLEENHDKRFSENKFYIDGCKANKNLNPKDYKIQPNHNLGEYFNKYGNKILHGNLLAFKENELWLMDKDTTYWKIENVSEFTYFPCVNLNKKKIIIISMVSCLVVGGLIYGGLKLFTNHQVKMVNTNNCTYQLDKSSYNINDIATVTLTTLNDYSFPETLPEEAINISGGNFVSYEFISRDDDKNITTSELKIQVKTGDINFSVPVIPNEHHISFSGAHVDTQSPETTYHKDDEVELEVNITEGDDFHLPEITEEELDLTNCTFISATPSNDTTKSKIKIKIGKGEETKRDDCNVVLQKTIQNEHNVNFVPVDGYHLNSTAIEYENEDHHYLNDTVTITLAPDWDYLLPVTTDVTSATASNYFAFDNCRFNSYTLANDSKSATLEVKIGTSSTVVAPGNCTVTANKAMIQKEHEVTFSVGSTTGLEQNGTVSYEGGKPYHNKVATINLKITTGKDYELPSSITSATASNWFTFNNCRFDSYSSGVLKVKIGKSDSVGEDGINEGDCTVTLIKNANRNHHTITMKYPAGVVTGPNSVDSNDVGVATISTIALATGKDYQDLTASHFTIDGTPNNVSITSFIGGVLTVTFNDDYSGGNISITCAPIRKPHIVAITYPVGMTGDASATSDDDGVAVISNIATKSAYQPLTASSFAITGAPANVSITSYESGKLKVTFNDDYSGGDIAITCTLPAFKHFTITMVYTGGDLVVKGDASATSDDAGVATISNIVLQNTSDYKAIENSNFSIGGSPSNVSLGFENGTLTITFDSDYSGSDITITCSPLLLRWYDFDNWWDYCSDGSLKQATTEDIGKEVEVTVNELKHKVRLIGISHDDLVTGGKAHCTFEFSSILSDSNGYSLATPWFWDCTSVIEITSYDFPNSNLRKALDGLGNGSLAWYQKGQSYKSTAYTTSALNMLPNGLQAAIKEVKKLTATTASYSVSSYNTKVFSLSHREITTQSDSGVKDEGSIYAYYRDGGKATKRQVKKDEQYTIAAGVNDCPGDLDSANNYAGYNNTTSELGGGAYWLRSPATIGRNDYSWYIWGYSTNINNWNTYRYLVGVAPAFCI